VQPTLNQQKVDKGALDIERAGYDNQIKAVEAANAETEKRLSITKSQQEMKDYAKAHQLWEQLKGTGALYTNDPNKQAEIQAQLAMGGIKWDPPNSNYTTVKNKDGSFWMLDKTNGQIGKVGKDGKVSQWQPLSQ
jgi:hypothetical protein